MLTKHPISVPNLKDYRDYFASQGVSTPLRNVPFSEVGLLKELPSPKDRTGWPWTVETKINFGESFLAPKISIVMPSYNQGKYVEETIRSVLLQNYPNLEFIVCDGGSTDNTIEILEKYSPWLSFWQSKKDRGQGHAINLGFSLASGDYFGWINSDDFYSPNCLYKVAKQFVEVNKDFIYGDSLTLDENKKWLSYTQSFLVLDRYLRFGGIIPSHAAFWKKSIHQPIWEDLNCAVDAELWLRLVVKRSKSHLRYPLAVSRVQPDAKSVNEGYQKLWEDDYNKKIWKAYESVNFWQLRCYEFRYIQKIYKHLFKPIPKQIIQGLLQRDDLTLF
ncbi:MAG: hypothetical protein DCF19_15930 [Pseudanabaena frigida]|uniref:Glycosyltransferase 2-like domain-containing protein n=1 Tax=Pseudanabaena frigida TaxID=945775 RepID=A0A2W4W2Z2_9CYAN|nr:MAG: hypothetical protein DCF19_15930 [Pseudanabaena frigida]